MSTCPTLLDLQQRFVDYRFGMFQHFNMATYQDREWGDPEGPLEAFLPSHLDTDQWAEAAISAGMKFGCLTTKHHDGFCLWPTLTGSPSVAQTPGRQDVVRSYSDSFRTRGLSVGLYYSILDLRSDIRHFNVTPEKIKLIKDHLSELLTNYGEISFLIFDGWDAPWSRIPYTEVPFDEIYQHVKSLQPNCLVCDLNASQYPESGLYYSDIKSFEQNAGQEVPNDNSLPALSCVTLTDGWFWKERDRNAELKPVAKVVNEWLRPQNERFCTMILNAPPNREGKLAPNLVRRLKEIGEFWKHPGPAPALQPSPVITTNNLATGQSIRASVSPDTVGPDQAVDGDFDSSWYLEEGYETGWLEITFRNPVSFTTLVVVQPKDRSDRIAKYEWSYSTGDGHQPVQSGENPAAVQIDRVPKTTAGRVRLEFWASKPMPHIAEIGLYNEPGSYD